MTLLDVLDQCHFGRAFDPFDGEVDEEVLPRALVQQIGKLPRLDLDIDVLLIRPVKDRRNEPFAAHLSKGCRTAPFAGGGVKGMSLRHGGSGLAESLVWRSCDPTARFKPWGIVP